MNFKKIIFKLKFIMFLVLFGTIIGGGFTNNITVNAVPLKGNCIIHSDGVHVATAKEMVICNGLQGEKIFMSRSACDCGAEVLYDGFPYYPISPYMGRYSTDYTLKMTIQGRDTYQLNNMYYSDGVLSGWEFHGMGEDNMIEK